MLSTCLVVTVSLYGVLLLLCLYFACVCKAALLKLSLIS